MLSIALLNIFSCLTKLKFTLFEETVYSSDGCSFVVAPQQVNMIWVQNLVGVK